MKLLSSYTLFIILIASCAVTAGISLTAVHLNRSADKALMEISKSSTITSDKITVKINRLLKSAEDEDIFVFSERDAKKWFLDALDNFLKKYDAKIITPMQKADGAFRARISFRFTPKTPHDLVLLLEYMENSTAPVVIIENTAFINTPKEKYVNITAELIQPYAEGAK